MNGHTALEPRPRLRMRLLVASIVASAMGSYYWWGVLRTPPHLAGDFTLNWIAARAVLAGHNPVAVAATSGWQWPLYYPLPAQLVSIPFALLPFIASECVYVGVGAGVLAFAMTRHRWWGLLIFLTPSFLHAYYNAQWTPLLTGAMLLPWLSGILAVKPSTGLAYFFSRPSWKGFAGALALVLLCFLVRPSWVGDWLGAISHASAIIPPIVRPGGFLLLIALPFWRRADARLLVGLALVPHRTLFYEALPLFTIPRTFRQMASLVIIAAVAAVWLRFEVAVGPDEVTQMAAQWPVLLVCLYLPALAMLIRNAVAPQFRDADLGQEDE